MHRRSLFGVGILCSALAAAAEPTFTPNPRVQANIHDITHSLGSPELRQKLDSLAKEFELKKTELVPELAYYSSRGTNSKEAMICVFIARQVGIDDVHIVNGLAPHVGTNDLKLRKAAREWIREADEGLHDKEEGTKYVRGLIHTSARRKEEVSPALAAFTFETNPSAALHDFVSAYLSEESEAGKKLIWADHVIRDAMWRKKHRFNKEFEEMLPTVMRELRWLSAHDQFWVRAYAASILRQRPELANPELINMLKDDAHELVRKMIKAGGASKRP